MTLDTLIMFIGTMVAVLPFLGFPNSWDTVFFFILGVSTIVLGIIVRRRIGNRRTRETGGTFVENVPSRAENSQFENGHEEA